MFRKFESSRSCARSRELSPRLRFTLMTVLFGGCLLACSAALPQPTSTDAARATLRWPGLTRQDLVSGRELYVDHCSACHRLPLPDRHAPDEWPSLVQSMSERAHLDAAQAQQVLRYLVTMSERSGVQQQASAEFTR